MDRVFRALEKALRNVGNRPDVKALAGDGNADRGPLEGVTALHPARVSLPLFMAPATNDERNTLRKPLHVTACFRLNDARFGAGTSFLLPEARLELAALGKLLAKHPDHPISIFAHAQPTGDDDADKALSGRRAEALHALLTRDTGVWERLSREPLGSDDWSAFAGLLPGSGGSASPGEAEDAAPTAKRFRDYMDRLATDPDSGDELTLDASRFLAGGADPMHKGDAQGCGSFDPVLVLSEEQATDLARPEARGRRDVEHASNRRVVVFLFEPGTVVDPGAWPCPRVGEGPGGCRKRLWSDADARRTPTASARHFEDTHDTFACRFYHRLAVASPCERWIPVEAELSHLSLLLRSNSGAVPLSNLPYRIEIASDWTIEGTTDDEGFLEHPDIPPGDYKLEIEGVQVLVPTLPIHIARRVQRVPGFVLG